MSEAVDSLQVLFDHPDQLGREIGFTDLTELHGMWIRKMVFEEGDYTLQAHRGSYKSSCLAVAISLMLVLYCKQNIIFLRKTDSDVSEMLGMLSPGLHKISIEYLDGEAEGTFTIENEVTPTATLSPTPSPTPRPVPKTGDSNHPVLWIGLILLGIAGLAAFAAMKASRKRK